MSRKSRPFVHFPAPLWNEIALRHGGDGHRQPALQHLLRWQVEGAFAAKWARKVHLGS